MGEKTKIGTCKLCLCTTELLESHYIPRAAYKIIKRANNANPVLVSEKVAVQTDKQIKDYLLCSSCEDRFNKFGERWVLDHCFQSDGSFKLKSLIQNAGALFDNGKLQAYSAATIPEINIEKLAYFAASLIWRGASHKWRIAGMPVSQLELGPKYEEELRLFLLGAAPFPTNAVLWVSIAPSANLSEAFTPPCGVKDKARQFWNYRFSFLGIIFIFLLGKRLDIEARRMCSYRSKAKWIYSGKAVDENLILDLAPSVRASRPAGIMAQR